MKQSASVTVSMAALVLFSTAVALHCVSPARSPYDGWQSLFDGRTLAGWKATEFEFEKPGPVRVEDGRLILSQGLDLTAVTATQPVPRMNYEVSLEAMRVEGADFFCGLTFPVGDECCTLIIGGWSGGVCGLSSLDGFDAANNDTGLWRDFENGRWYRIRLAVTPETISAWIDDEPILEEHYAGRRLSVREEVRPCRPFGLASWQTTAALREIRVRPLTGSR